MDLLLQDLALDLYLLPFLLIMLLVQGKQPDKLWLIRLTGAPTILKGTRINLCL